MVNKKISVVIPTYNEENTIINTINETIRVLKDIKDDFEIIVIDDGSADKTSSIVSKRMHNYDNKVAIKRYHINKGKGYALKYGTSFVKGDFVLFLDADLDLHPRELINFIKIMKEKNADVVIGSKMHKNSFLDYPKIRRLYSFFYYLIIKTLFRLPIKDTQTGIKFFKADALKKAISKTTIKRYAFDLELLVVLNKMGYKIVEGPIFLKSTRKIGRIGLKDVLTIFKDTFVIFNHLLKKTYI